MASQPGVVATGQAAASSSHSTFTQLDIETEKYKSELLDFLQSMRDHEPAVCHCLLSWLVLRTLHRVALR
jgi:hypothetical protein